MKLQHIKHGFLPILLSILAIVGLGTIMTAQVNAQSTQTTNQCPTRDVIRSGLLAGINFDLKSIGTCEYSGGAVDSKQERPAQSWLLPQSHQNVFKSAQPAPPPSIVLSGLYIALGDSVAAGAGLPTSQNPTNNDVLCSVSANSYPAFVASGLNRSYINAACSGATVGDLVTKQQVRGPNVEAQLNTAYAHGIPSVVSITAGANDARWVDFLRKCYVRTCGTNFDDSASRTLLAAVGVKLDYALADIQRRSGSQPPRVVLTGYYNSLSANCSAQVPSLTAAEIAWLNRQVSSLNSQIQNSAAKYPFATFAAVDFTGHELCSTDPWLQGLNDLAPFHPTARGQQAIAQSVLNASR